MKKLSRLMAMLLVGILLLSGCASDGANTDPASAPEQSGQTDSTDAGTGASDTGQDSGQTADPGQESPYWKKYDPAISLTQNFAVDELQVEQVPAGMSFDDNHWTWWAYDTYGID